MSLMVTSILGTAGEITVDSTDPMNVTFDLDIPSSGAWEIPSFNVPSGLFSTASLLYDLADPSDFVNIWPNNVPPVDSFLIGNMDGSLAWDNVFGAVDTVATPFQFDGAGSAPVSSVDVIFSNYGKTAQMVLPLDSFNNLLCDSSGNSNFFSSALNSGAVFVPSAYVPSGLVTQETLYLLGSIPIAELSGTGGTLSKFFNGNVYFYLDSSDNCSIWIDLGYLAGTAGTSAFEASTYYSIGAFRTGIITTVGAITFTYQL